jgi:hypothetical protein
MAVRRGVLGEQAPVLTHRWRVCSPGVAGGQVYRNPEEIRAFSIVLVCLQPFLYGPYYIHVAQSTSVGFAVLFALFCGFITVRVMWSVVRLLGSMLARRSCSRSGAWLHGSQRPVRRARDALPRSIAACLPTKCIQRIMWVTQVGLLTMSRLMEDPFNEEHVDGVRVSRWSLPASLPPSPSTQARQSPIVAAHVNVPLDVPFAAPSRGGTQQRKDTWVCGPRQGGCAPRG